MLWLKTEKKKGKTKGNSFSYDDVCFQIVVLTVLGKTLVSGEWGMGTTVKRITWKMTVRLHVDTVVRNICFTLNAYFYVFSGNSLRVTGSCFTKPKNIGILFELTHGVTDDELNYTPVTHDLHIILVTHGDKLIYILSVQVSFTFNTSKCILVPRGHDQFGQYEDSRPLAAPNTGSPRFTDSLLSNVPNLIGWELQN